MHHPQSNLIAFMGDVHGCVFHALGALALLQVRRGIRLDAVVQVGDLGAYRSVERLPELDRSFIAANPAQGDFFSLLEASTRVADSVARVLDQIPPVLFVSGNHDDLDWLEAEHEAQGNAVVPVDPLGAFHHVACGHVADVAGQRVAFLGRIELPEHMDLDDDAYMRLLAAEPGSVDVLVTHDGPYGMAVWNGDVQGSRKLARLIEHLQPRLHVAGHYHHENGPRQYGRTTSYGLAQLVSPANHPENDSRANPDQRVDRGSIGVLDTAAYAFEYVHDDWLSTVRGVDLDLAELLETSSPD